MTKDELIKIIAIAAKMQLNGNYVGSIKHFYDVTKKLSDGPSLFRAKAAADKLRDWVYRQQAKRQNP